MSRPAAPCRAMIWCFTARSTNTDTFALYPAHRRHVHIEKNGGELLAPQVLERGLSGRRRG
jgi:hypothetical protein